MAVSKEAARIIENLQAENERLELDAYLATKFITEQGLFMEYIDKLGDDAWVKEPRLNKKGGA